ncbi:hypothetical protein VFPPC_13265 [Pochonia chlamydosporia 170]|uniref:Streptomyces killer toxin-like beta/gamma crystallin domain-containing protein n=1 Tax=Pochonia chlamydosporia 170 TaxID=1380566 RepID=A0A179FW14_METCM|nr:hypothetical protein VFPPC_13265 [Pochonia chlamydosporia 170]OAQ69846.1 hypothetical protein VFPPC_13265 [Pochonia chlamydosporia 170]
MLKTNLITLLALTASVAPGVNAVKEINFLTCFFAGKYFSLDYTNFFGGRVWTRCWADRGDKDMRQTSVVSYSSGNNAGWFEYEPGDGSRYKHTFQKNSGVRKRKGKYDWGLVLKIHID